MRVNQEDVLFSFKVVICGAGAAGKTCLFNRYCFNSFHFNTAETIGLNFHTTYLPLKFKEQSPETDNKYVINSIFDLAGQAKFKPLVPKFLDGANSALLVFDSVSFSSFQQLDEWYEQLKNQVKSIPMLLIGSKSDLLKTTPKGQIVKDELINEFVKEKKLNGFYRTSALENYNVIDVFKRISNIMLKDHNIDAEVI